MSTEALESWSSPPGRERLVKLVRDGIEKHLADTSVEYRPINDPEVHREELCKKLLEEALEYALNPSIGELADIHEVVVALAEVMHGSSFTAVQAEAASKAADRGGFRGGMGMYVRTSATVHG